MKELDDDMVSLMKKRVYDLSGCTPRTVNIYLNGKKIDKIKDFESYVSLYFKSSEESTRKVIHHKEDRWEVCFTPSESF
jgi:DNA topoisomerase-2